MPGELRVARLAAECRTNREIARALFITTKTVKDHLDSAYRQAGDRFSRRTQSGPGQRRTVAARGQLSCWQLATKCVPAPRAGAQPRR